MLGGRVAEQRDAQPDGGVGLHTQERQAGRWEVAMGERGGQRQVPLALNEGRGMWAQVLAQVKAASGQGQRGGAR